MCVRKWERDYIPEQSETLFKAEDYETSKWNKMFKQHERFNKDF